METRCKPGDLCYVVLTGSPYDTFVRCSVGMTVTVTKAVEWFDKSRGLKAVGWEYEPKQSVNVFCSTVCKIPHPARALPDLNLKTIRGLPADASGEINIKARDDFPEAVLR